MMRLGDAPVGLFLWKEVLVLKTEYHWPDGKPECYIVESGEVFHGGVRYPDDYNNLEVTPVEVTKWQPRNQ